MDHCMAIRADWTQIGFVINRITAPSRRQEGGGERECSPTRQNRIADRSLDRKPRNPFGEFRGIDRVHPHSVHIC